MEPTYPSGRPLEISGKVNVEASRRSQRWTESLVTKMAMTFTQEKDVQVPNKWLDYDIHFLENMSLRLVLTYPYSASFVFAFFLICPFDFFFIILSISTSSAKPCKKIIQDDRKGNILTSLWFSIPE